MLVFFFTFSFNSYFFNSCFLHLQEWETLGYPPLSKEHSKMAMLDKLAPIAAKAYRRKKMSETKMGKLPCDQQTHEDMDLDDGCVS